MRNRSHMQLTAGGFAAWLIVAAAAAQDPAIGMGHVNVRHERQIVHINTAREAEYITLAGQRVNPLTARDAAGNPVNLAAAARQVADNLRVVQFARPLDGAVLAALAQQGITVLGAIPDNAFILRVPADTLAGVRALPGVRWIGNYAPEYRYSDLLQEALRGRAAMLPTIRLRVVPVAGADMHALVQALRALGTVEQEDALVVFVTLPTEAVGKVAALANVLLVDYAPLNELHNNVAADIVDARDMWRVRNLTGSNEIVAVADTGLDLGVNTTALHQDFQDNAGNTRVVQIFDNIGDGANDPYSGHGTHVAGSVLGNGRMSGSWPQTNGFPAACYAGIAPKARLVFQAQCSNHPAWAGTVLLPNGMTGLLTQAYNAGARIHQNSWGMSVYGRYDSVSRDLDIMTFFKPELLVCFSAGNDGTDTNPPSGVVELGAVGRPGTAKNCITVGATENVRSTTESGTWGGWYPSTFAHAPINGDHVANAPTGMAAFSSRGPCRDGRIKPDICAPGTYVASTRTHAIPLATGILWGQGTLLAGNSNYVFSGGTSMATPMVAGAAAVYREYVRTVHHWPNPPACLIKAMLLNGATDIAPGQYGTGATQEIGAAPNNVQGWGRLNVEEALYGGDSHAMLLWTGAFASAGQFSTNINVYDSARPLKVHLAWTDFASSVYTYDQRGGGLMNDLDLRVVGPGNQTNFPRAMDTRVCISAHTNDDWFSYYMTPVLRWEATRLAAPQLPLTLTRLDRLVYATAAGTNAMFVWSEVDGKPGAILFAITNVVPVGFWIYNYNVSVPLPTTNFFIGSRLLGGAAYSPRDRSGGLRAYYDTGAGWMAQDAGDLWMHAYGTVVTGDHVNTVEGVIITNPPAGTYKVIVSGNNLPWPPVHFGVAMSGSLVPEPAVVLGLCVAVVLLRRLQR